MTTLTQPNPMAVRPSSHEAYRVLADRLCREHPGVMPPGQVLGLVTRVRRMLSSEPLSAGRRIEVCEVITRQLLADRSGSG